MQVRAEPVVLSIVTPVYQAEPFIDAFYHRMTAAALRITPHYEIIFVNDGSTDASLEKLIALQENDMRVVVIDLSRNFGMHPAIRCGIEHAIGSYIFIIVSDLQEAPEWLSQLYNKLQESKVDIVYAHETRRINTLVYRVLCRSFYSLIKFLCPSAITEIACARLITKPVRNALVEFRERSTVLDVLCWAVGFRHDFIEVVKAPPKGTTFTFIKRLTQAVCDHITSLTTSPLIWAWYLAFFYVIVSVGIWIFAYPASASTTISVLVLGMAGILAILGIFGIYMSALFKEIKQRPLFVVRAIYKAPNHSIISG